MRRAGPAAWCLLAIMAAGGFVSAVEFRLPDDARIINVRRDFGARGDGTADDTKPITAAIIHSLSQDRYTAEFIYFPNGTYLVSDTLKNKVPRGPAKPRYWSNGWLVGVVLVGQSRDGVVIKLKDNCPGYSDPSKPKAVIRLGSEMHGRKQFDVRPHGYGNCGFRNTIMNLTVDTGRGNPGAIGIAFLANNRGAVENVTIRDPDRALCGLDMTTPWPGPALIKNVAIEGFDYGIRQKSMDCGMTLEHIVLRSQRVVAIEAIRHPTMSMRGIVSHNAVPVLKSTDGGRGLIMFLDSSFTYTGDRPDATAIFNSENLLLENVEVRGYKTVVKNQGKNLRPDLTLQKAQGRVDFYVSRDPVRLFPIPERPPNLPIKETPEWHSTDLSKWANVEKFNHGSSTCGIQEAIDSGAEVVYLPNGVYETGKTIVIRGNVRKIIGMEARFNDKKTGPPIFRYDGTTNAAVFIEHLCRIVVVHNSTKALVVRHCDLVRYESTPQGTGDAFIEDVMGAHPRINSPQSFWARQLNSEYGRIPQLVNNGGKVWVLGMKCESKMPLVINNRGVLEVYALYSMTNPQPERDTPMIVNNEGRMAVSFADGGQKSYWTKIKETQRGQTRLDQTWRRETMLYLGGPP